ncbi:MAG TPA: hypothetical protein VE135_29155 [Pyrinomonadaceae bacterium]|nr:hypothetical protein [Pyrinomonadaceae bacterium]
MSTSYNLPSGIKRVQVPLFAVGALLFAILLIGLFIDRAQFFHSYLFGFTFWLGLAVGSLALLMLQHLVNGGWGFVIRRVLEAATRTLPLLAVFFLPILVGAKWIYPWMHHERMGTPALAEKAAKYLNLPFFTIRAAIYFAVWIGLAFLLSRWSAQQDRNADPLLKKRMGLLSGPGMVLLIITVTFASIDWYMSITPEWSSTIYGFIFVAAWALSALAFVVAVMALLTGEEPLKQVVAPLHFQDLGKLLLALVMLWAYFAFSQFLIIWSGNLPEEIHWYLPRLHDGWGAIVLTVVTLHFGLPFLLLLSRSLKRNPRRLVMVAGLILVMRLVDLFWMIAPSFTEEHLRVSWMDVLAPLAFGGLWLGAFLWELGKHPLIPINDPQLESVLEQVHANH